MSVPGRYDSVSLEEAIASAKMMMRLDNTDYDIVFEKWGHDALRHIDGLDTYVLRESTLEVCDYKVKLPCGFYSLVALTFIDENGVCSEGVYINRPYLTSCGCDITEGVIDYEGSFQIQDGYIYLASDITATEIKLVYRSLNVDDDGLIRMYEWQERAVTAYICWRFTQQNFELFPVNIRESYAKEWRKQKQYCKGFSGVEAFRNERYQIQRIFGGIMVNKNTYNR